MAPGVSQGQLGSTQSQGLVPCVMFVLKEMLPSYHRWRYNSHGVREQIGKDAGHRAQGRGPCSPPLEPGAAYSPVTPVLHVQAA